MAARKSAARSERHRKHKTQSKEQRLHHNSHGEKVSSCIFTSGEYSRSVLNVPQRYIRSPSENRMKLDHSYIVLIQRSTNLHKSKSHIQLLWTLNEHAPEEKQLLPNGVGRRAARAKRAGPVNESQYGKSELQSVQLYALDTLEENHVPERKEVSCSRSPADDRSQWRLGTGGDDDNTVSSGGNRVRANFCSADRSSAAF